MMYSWDISLDSDVAAWQRVTPPGEWTVLHMCNMLLCTGHVRLTTSYEVLLNSHRDLGNLRNLWHRVAKRREQ